MSVEKSPPVLCKTREKSALPNNLGPRWKLAYTTAFIALGLGFAYNWYFNYDNYVHVETDKGILRGLLSTTYRQGAKYLAFKGIRYAKPPIGELRFKAPREETPWIGVRDAMSHGGECPQLKSAGLVRGEEDCLFLNIYIPALESKNLPVMFWIHGGRFSAMSGNAENYGPDFFMETGGIILVTINYRLGPLGFLSTGDHGAPGNAGLKDQVAALRWVRRNIAKFGGDPDNVTLFGGSSGAASVHFHVLSPMSRGLFAKAMSHGGLALNTWAVSDIGPEVTIRLAEALGAKDVARNTTRALEFLKTAPYEDMIKLQFSLVTEEERRMSIMFVFAPVVEKGVTSEEVFLPESPLRTIKYGNFYNVPYVAGYTSREGFTNLLGLQTPESMELAIKDTDRFIPIDIKNPQLRNDLTKSIRKFYFEDKPISNENIINLVDLWGDALMAVGIKRTFKLHLKYTKSPSYFFVFGYEGRLNLGKFIFNITLPGATHGDESGYLFRHERITESTVVEGSEDERVLNMMLRLWTNFAKYGNPTPAGDPLNWKPATTDEFNFLNISGDVPNLGVNPDPERTNFWDKVYENDIGLED